MKKKILMATLFSIAMVCSAFAQEVKVVKMDKKIGNDTMTVQVKECCTKEKGKTNILISGMGTKKTPLLIVDGEVYEKEMNSIDPNQIESIDVLKGPKQTEKYGEKGKYGVILITMKKPLDVAKALVVLNGKVTKKSYKDIKPKDVKGMNVLTGKTAIAKYGEKAANGVIELTTK